MYVTDAQRRRIAEFHGRSKEEDRLTLPPGAVLVTEDDPRADMITGTYRRYMEDG